MNDYIVCDMANVNLNTCGVIQSQPGIYHTLYNALEYNHTVYAINAKLDNMTLSPMLITDIHYKNNTAIVCIIAMRECYTYPDDTLNVAGMWGEYAIADDIRY